MKYTKYFENIPTIKLYDDLSEFLGASDDGIIEFSYADIVKSAGHSCATVAGAYIMAMEGLKVLYPDSLPKRGKIKVELNKDTKVDNTGVVGFVLSIITGATTDFGFGGIPTGKFNRRDTLSFNIDMEYNVAFTDIETNKKVCVKYMPKKVVDPMSILKSAIKPDATQEDIESFPQRFQDMVKTVFANIDTVIEVVECK